MPETDDASVRTVVVAVAANLLTAVAKAVAAVLTGSAAMLAETTHSIADTCNEMLLYVGVRHGVRPANDHHPFRLREGPLHVVVAGCRRHLRRRRAVRRRRRRPGPPPPQAV